MADREARRRGGREARRIERARPLADAIRPVWPGLEGGRYQPLSDTDIPKIHKAALDILEQVGFADAIPSCIEMTTARGAFVNEHDRLCFPRAMVEDTIAKAARHFPLFGQDPKHDMQPFGKRVYFGTAGAAVHMVDAESGVYRESTLDDLYAIASSTVSITSTFSNARSSRVTSPIRGIWTSTRATPRSRAPRNMSVRRSPNLSMSMRRWPCCM